GGTYTSFGFSCTALPPTFCHLSNFLGFSAGVTLSIHLSATANGRMQLVALPEATLAVAVALTPWDEMFNSGPKMVGNGVLPNSPFRYTSTRTHEPVTPGGHAHDTCAVGAEVHTLLARAAPIALENAFPLLAGGSVSSS